LNYRAAPLQKHKENDSGPGSGGESQKTAAKCAGFYSKNKANYFLFDKNS